jgi:hypothetical protein
MHRIFRQFDGSRYRQRQAKKALAMVPVYLFQPVSHRGNSSFFLTRADGPVLCNPAGRGGHTFIVSGPGARSQGPRERTTVRQALEKPIWKSGCRPPHSPAAAAARAWSCWTACR